MINPINGSTLTLAQVQREKANRELARAKEVLQGLRLEAGSQERKVETLAQELEYWQKIVALEKTRVI